MTEREELDRWEMLIDLLLGLREVLVASDQTDPAITVGSCIALTNELAAHEIIYPEIERLLRRGKEEKPPRGVDPQG